jgi:hypothetical protein
MCIDLRSGLFFGMDVATFVPDLERSRARIPVEGGWKGVRWFGMLAASGFLEIAVIHSHQGAAGCGQLDAGDRS